MYPAMTMEEACEKLNTIPVFAVTDDSGNGVIVRDEEEDAKVFWLFLQPEIAKAMLESLQSKSSSVTLKVSTVPLGVIYPKLAKKGQSSGEKQKTADGQEVDVQMRLAPNPYDLAYARNITMQQQAPNGTITDTEKADLESKLKTLNTTWGVVPVFTMASMQIMRNDTAIRPWFASLEDCIGAYQQAVKGTDDEDAAHGLHMTTLDDLIQAMMSPSPADFRNMQFMPSMKAQIYVQEMAKAAMDAMQNGAGGPGGSTNDLLGDDDDDGSDDGGLFG